MIRASGEALSATIAVRAAGASFAVSKIIESLERGQLRDGIPQFKAGDTVRVHFQVFEGIVIKRQGNGIHESFTVRKQSFGVGVERTFPLHSPKIERIEVAAIGDVNRAKLYYLRGRVGKRARVREKQRTEKTLRATEAAPAVTESVADAGSVPAEAAEQPGAAEAEEPTPTDSGAPEAEANEPRGAEAEAVPAGEA